MYRGNCVTCANLMTLWSKALPMTTTVAPTTAKIGIAVGAYEKVASDSELGGDSRLYSDFLHHL